MFEKTRDAIAPGIYGHSEVKEALVLQLFGGTKDKQMPGGAPIREDIHILLIGDPGSAKCVEGDTEILFSDGSKKRIDEIVEKQLKNGYQTLKDGIFAEGNHDVFSLSPNKKIVNGKATHFFKLEAPEWMYEVETASGKKVTTTPYHPFFVHEKGTIKSVKTENLNIGDFVATINEEKSLLNSDVCWEKVVTKRKVKPKTGWVYDLTVAGTHNFVANSIIVHNTRFLQYVKDIAPKGIYVSGKSVTGVGLTAAAEKDDLGDGGWTLKAGALVIASGGIASVDEFDKIDENERAAMHEVMESQTVSVAKAGIVAQFKAKTGILAAANPKFGRFDQNKLPGVQFDIPPTILSRFDLIFPILDVMDAEKDTALANYLLGVHQSSTKPGNTQAAAPGETGAIDKFLLRKYIAYARQHVKPSLSNEAMEKIKTFYVELRRRGKAEGAVPITPRQIEGLVRLSEASAKIRLSDTVEAADAERAIRLTTYVLDKVSRDRETGQIDADILMTGRPKSQVDKINAILTIAQRMQAQLGVIEITRLMAQAADQNIDEITSRRIIDDLIYKGELYKVKPGVVKIVEQSG